MNRFWRKFLLYNFCRDALKTNFYPPHENVSNQLSYNTQINWMKIEILKISQVNEFQIKRRYHSFKFVGILKWNSQIRPRFYPREYF